MYGILLRMGGPNSLRPSLRRFRPPISTVPPSGTFTVVFTDSVFKVGCWMNCVNGTGWPTAPPSNTGVINVVIGKSGTLAEARLDRLGASDMRTKRRSAEITAFMLSWMPPVGNRLFDGTKTIWPPAWTTETAVTKNCWSVTLMVEVWPLNKVSFGASMTLVRWSPWAASRNMVTSISLRKARPSDRPPLPPGMFGYSPNGGMAMPKLEFLTGIFRSCVKEPPGVKPDRNLLGVKWLMNPNGWNCCDTIWG